MRSCVVLFVLLAACGGSPATGDAAISDAKQHDASFPGCAPTESEICSEHLCWVNPQVLDDQITAVAGSGCDYWLVGGGVYRLNGDVLSSVAAPGGGSTRDLGVGHRGIVTLSDQVWITGVGTYRFDGTRWLTTDTQYGAAIWGDSEQDMWVLLNGQLARWDGTAFEMVTAETGAAMWGTSGHDIRVATFAPTPTLLHWNGTAIENESAPSQDVMALWASSPDDWYAIGFDGDDVIWHREATGAWTVVYREPFAGGGFRAIWGANAHDIWVGGAGLDHAVHLDGATWTPVPLPTPADVGAIHGSGPDDVVFAGVGFVARWNGKRVESVLTARLALDPGEGGWVGMHGTSVTDVWALADHGTTAHWDGATWQQGKIAPGIVTEAIGGTASDDIWVAGATASMTVWHWDGAAWSATALPMPGMLRAIHAASRTDVWAVGDAGTIFHYDGAWHAMHVPTTAELVGVWGNHADAWAISGVGIYHWDGVAWTSISMASAGTFTSVWGRASNEVYFGTSIGALWRFNGTGLVRTLESNAAISEMGGDAARRWFVGGNWIGYDHGTGLQMMYAPRAVWTAAYFPTRTDGWIVGTGGAIMRYRP
jgi:hypothetical protein